MRAVSDTRMIIGSLIASNMVLMALHVAPSMQRFLRRCAMRLWPKAPASLQTSPLGGLLGKDYIPPLPEPVINVLNRACLCFLATASVELSPHLSLMRFSYCKPLSAADGEVLVLSTRRETLKYKMLTQNRNVALLVHDFVSEEEGDARNYEVAMTGSARYSITLNGRVTEEVGEMAEEYRAIHLKRNN